MSRRPVLHISTRALLLGLLSLCGPAVTIAQGVAPIIVQPAEWANMQTPSPSGTRSNAPVTFGLGIPDAWAIPCTLQASPAQLELKNGSTVLNAQFRTTGCWPDGKVEWVLVDAQLPSFVEGSPGYDTTITVTQVASGGGNNPAAGMAAQCTGSGAPVAACPDANHIVVNTTAAAFLVKENNYNLFDDVNVGGTHLVAAANHGANDGLFLAGPTHAVILAGGINSVSCGPGPIPTNYAGAACATPYLSNLDSASTCTIEENGPLRSVVMCQGDMKNASGDVYMHWRTRMHFWLNHSDAKVTVALRNADVTPGVSPNFTNAYKEFQQFEARLTDNLASVTRNFQIANDTATPTTGTLLLNGTDNALNYEGYEQNGEWNDWTNGPNTTVANGDNDRNLVSWIPRSATGTLNYSQNGYTILKNGTDVGPGAGHEFSNSKYPIGWADLDDGTNGIETGVYQFSMYWPKSLEFQPTPSGATSGNEIRIGIWPNQTEFPVAELNSSYSSAGPNSAPQVSYAMGWPQYAIHDLYFNFHSGTQTASVAQNRFLYFQHYLLARPQSATYYNTVVDATSALPALWYPIPDPVAEDTYYLGLSGVCQPTAPAGQCVGDVGSSNYAFGGTTNHMSIFRFFDWPAPGGTQGTQFDQRFSFLRNFEQRGCTPSGSVCGAASLTGSVPGRYIWAAHFERMEIERSLPRSDTATTTGSSAGFRSLCTSLSVCNGLAFFQWGDPKNNTNPSVWNGGMRNWGDAPNSQEHDVTWGIMPYYFLSGDEWAKEQILQGFKDRFENPFVGFNNILACPTCAAPNRGHLGVIRTMGHWFAGAARLMDFLCSINDPDCDKSVALGGSGPPATSPASSVATGTVMAGIEQNLAGQVALPFISAGYPLGFTETSGGSTHCELGTGVPQLCSQGSSPVRGTIEATTGGGGACTPSSTTPPCSLGSTWRGGDTFMHGIAAEGLFDLRAATLKWLGPNWHATVGAPSGLTSVACGAGSGPVCDGQTPLDNIVVGERTLFSALYGGSQFLSEENFINSGTTSTSGYTFTQSQDYLNASPGCTAGSNCLHDCSTGCTGLTGWFGIGGFAGVTNSIADLAGNTWQPRFEIGLQRAGSVQFELGSHIMQFAVNYILANNAAGGNSTTIGAGIPALKVVPGGAQNGITVTGCTGTGCSNTTTSCVGPTSGTGTCTLTWSAPPGLSTVGGNQYILKYLPCQTGVLTLYGNDCPSGGKTIVPALQFHSDITTAGTVGTSGITGNPVGSWLLDPAHNWNWFYTTDVPDGGANTMVPSGTSYTFHTAANTTYTFHLSAYTVSAATLLPVSQSFFSAAVGTSSGDSAHTFTLTAGGSNLASLVLSTTGDFTQTNTCAGTLTAGNSCTISVTFTATATGARNGTVVATYTGGSLSASLSGTGLTAGGVCIIPPIFGAACDALYTFNSQTVGLASSDSPVQETLSNTSGAGLASINCSTIGTNASDFIVGGTCAATLANNSVYQVPTSFTPGAAGARTGNIQVAYGGGGTVRTAASCSVADINTQIGLSSAGDTVNVPGGTCTWLSSGPLSLSLGITINGGGATINEGTTGTNVTPAVLSITTPASGLQRITNFNFVGSYNNGGSPIQIITNNSTTGATLRMDHDTFDDSSPAAQGTVLEMTGLGAMLVDHSTFTAHHGFDELIHNLGGSFASFWSNDYVPGGPVAVFLEDDTFTYTLSSGDGTFDGSSAIENFTGSRIVARHNTFNNMQIDAHGSTPGACSGSGTENSTRFWEIYNNTWNTSAGINQSQYVQLRGGSGVVFNNNVTGGNTSQGEFEFTEDCSSGTYPIRTQMGRGINQTSSPAYIWGTTGTTSLWQIFNGNTTFVQIGASTGACASVSPNHSPCDVVSTATQPATLNRCESAADVTVGCPVSYTYTPFTYPHPLITSGTTLVTAPLAGTGLAASVTLTPATYTFATTVLGGNSSDSPVTFTLTNSSSSIVTAISISLTGADASDYSDVIPATTCSTSLAIGASCQIFVNFAPVAIGVRTASLRISDSASSSPQSSNLFGTAIPPAINPTPSNPVTFGVAISDPSIPSTVKNEKYKEVSQSPLSIAFSSPDIRATEISNAYNFDHVALFGFLHQDRPRYATGTSSR